MPGISKRGSTMLTQKCGVTERLQPEHHADDADIGDRVVARALVRRQVGHDAAHIGRRHGADDGVGGEEFAAGRDAGDAPILRSRRA